MTSNPPRPMTTPDEGPVILFDGVCNFCAWSVRFVIARDPRAVFRFAPLQSDAGRRLLRDHGLDEGAMDSFVLVEGSGAWRESDAALRVCRHLRGPWRMLAALRVFPRPLRDPVYRFIARNRYRWFGRADQCLVPTPSLRSRFLD
jgi:predicted DCC family thiol-disulfide oxidoreductase YuxK